MNHVAAATPPADLRARWLALNREQPKLRARDAALNLGVSEAELVAARCGDDAVRLGGPWGQLVEALPGLGEIMALTRNEYCVHEKVGRYDAISISGHMGLVLGGAIDLRLFLNRWHFGFAVTDPAPMGMRRCLQFFDADGTAVHKVYLRPGSDSAAYDDLVARFRHPDQSGRLPVTGSPAAVEPLPDDAIDRDRLRQRWQALKDVHDFHAMLKDMKAARVQAMRLVGADLARPMRIGSFRAALEAAAAAEAPIMIFAGSPGVIQIHTGPVRKLVETGAWFNVLDPGFNLHLRQDGIASAWLVRKPTDDGIVTSLEIYDAQERQIAWMFGERKPGNPEREDWRAIVAALEAAEERA